MLPLLPNHLLVSLSKDSVSMIYRGGLTKSMIGEKHVDCKTEGSFQWQLLIDALDLTLAGLKLPAKTKLSVTLSSDMVRYLTLPPQNVNMSQTGKNEYANAAYKEIYGFVIANWVIKCHDAPPDQPILTAAIDFDLYEQIQFLAEKYQFNLQSIQPYLMTAFNALQSSIKGSNALLAVVEPNRILLVNLQKGYCQQVRTFLISNSGSNSSSNNWQTMLSQIIARESLIGDAEIKDVLIYAPLQEKTSLNVESHWLLKTLKVNNKMNIVKPPYAMLEAFQ